MFYIYTPYVTPSGKRVSRSKIIIYETVSRAPHTSLADNIRKFELTRIKYMSNTVPELFV